MGASLGRSEAYCCFFSTVKLKPLLSFLLLTSLAVFSKHLIVNCLSISRPVSVNTEDPIWKVKEQGYLYEVEQTDTQPQ